MLFLWNVGQKPMIHKSKRPSPKRKNSSFFGGFIERASLLAALKKKVAGGMTVEAAVVLPLFLFLFINLGGAIEMIRLHGNLQLALWECGNRMCVYGYVGSTDNAEEPPEEGADRSIWEEMGDIALSYTYIRSQVVNYVGEDYLEESPIGRGAEGLQFWESDVGSQDAAVSGDVLDIVLTYEVSPLMEMPYVKPFRMSNRYYGRLWTGYDVNAAEEEETRKDVVYVAENAEVYHESVDCTHLKLTIREVTWARVPLERNENGEKYSECSKCGDEESGLTVFIAKEGDFYHKDRDCPGLKRTIYAMLRELAIEKYRPCSRCSK